MRLALACLIVLLPARALAWDGLPRQVAGVSNAPALVATAHDGAYGAFVAWQESATAPVGAGTLHVTRLTPEGDPHPAWPAGGQLLGGGSATRSALRLLPDESGGAYAWWIQSGGLRMTRVLGDGTVASGWTASGRGLGSLTSAEHRPWVEPDGAGGVWVGRFQGVGAPAASASVSVIHLGADGQGAGGWPSMLRTIPLAAEDEWVYSASFAVAEDGGVWALVATGHVTEPGVAPGEWRLARLTATGQAHPSLPPEGVVLGPFEADQLGPAIPRLGISAVIGDGAGGVFVALGRISAGPSNDWTGFAQLQRRNADGSLHAQQPAFASMGSWYEQAWGSCLYVPCAWADYSVRLMRDGAGELVAAGAQTYTHIGLALALTQLNAAGGAIGQIGGASGAGVSLHPAFGSGFVISTFDPTGPTHAVYDPGYAYVGYSETGKSSSYQEETFSPYSPVYTGSDVASLPDGGALLVWGRAQEPTGLYALRTGANGSPLAVGPGAVPASRGLRLVSEGAALRTEWSAGAAGVLTLHDVAGRVRARVAVPEAAGTTALAPREPLTPGVYFARLARRDGTLSLARAVVLR